MKLVAALRRNGAPSSEPKLLTLPSVDASFLARSLRQAPRFWDPGLPGRFAAALQVRWRGQRKTPPKLALGRGPKSRTGQPSVRRPLRERRARRRAAWCRERQRRSVDFSIFRACVAQVSRWCAGKPRGSRDAASTPVDSSSQARVRSFFSSATRSAGGMVIGPVSPIVTCVVSQTPTQFAPMKRPQPMSNDALPNRVTPRPTS